MMVVLYYVLYYTEAESDFREVLICGSNKEESNSAHIFFLN